MCGVCGVVRYAGPAVAGDRARVQGMMSALAHRGPDETGVGGRDGAVLGITRLAIRGLNGGAQPVSDPGSGVTVICNGEIDNHRELREFLAGRGHAVRGESDVAVIPALYLELGDRFPEALTGAFAIALHDPRRRRLLLVRDRAGERPLFYHRGGETISFATEICALVGKGLDPLTVDRAALAGYLRFGSFTAPASPFSGVRKVPPAHRVVFENDSETARVDRWWRWPVGAAAGPPPTADEFDRVLRDVLLHQTENEVPFGVFLSGGIDSSLVAAVARTVRPQVVFPAYTLRFSEASYDEGDAAAAVAGHLGLPQVPVWVRPEDFQVELPRLIARVGEPLADPAWIPTALLARRAAEDAKVALVGEGADELFGGYPTYLGALMSARYAGLPGWFKAPVRRMVEAWPPSDKKVSISFLLKKFVAGAEMAGGDRHLLWTSNLPPALLERLGVAVPEPEMDTLPRLLDTVQRHDLETSLAEGLLTKADRASMSSALELRAPYLDRNVMEFAARLAPRDRVRRFTTKHFLKGYAERYLPRRIVRRRKRGLSVPLAQWLREDLHDWARDRVGDPSLERAGIDRSAALELFEEHAHRRADHSRAVWTLVVLAEWLRWAETASLVP